MATISKIQFNNTDVIHLYTSSATPRKSNLRIHYHSLIEISLILRGNGIYKVGSNHYSISAGDIFFFRPNEAHCITDIEEGGMDLLNLHVSPYYVYSNFQNALNSNFIKILTSNFTLKSNKINDTLPCKDVKTITDLFFSIRNELEEKNSDYVTFVNNYISSILILFSRAYKHNNFSQKEKQNYQKLLSTIKYIDTHYTENITLDTLAKNMAYSRCYFSSIFKKSMGMSIWDYICIKRIEQALTLIKTTDKNIADVAFECGFNTVVNFNKIFKKYTNVSPHTFRK